MLVEKKLFPLKMLKKFVTENVNLIDFRKIDKFWLVDLLTASKQDLI
jgi:hypothetical protein